MVNTASKPLSRNNTIPFYQLLTRVFERNSEVASSILSIIQKDLDLDSDLDLDIYPLNYFQFLAIHSLLKKPIAPATLEIISSTALSEAAFDRNKLLESFSEELLDLVIENLVAIKNDDASLYPTVQKIINAIPERPEKNSLHSYWRRFINNNWVNPDESKSDQWKTIAKKIEEYASIPDTSKIILFFYGHLYSLLDPKKVRLKEIEECIKKDRRAQEANSAEAKQENRREFTRKLALGMVSAVSKEYMEELYGEQVGDQMKIFTKRYGTTFYSVKDEEAKAAVLCEARLGVLMMN